MFFFLFLISRILCEFVCFGIPASNSSVCSGRGSCNDNDLCLCNNQNMWGGSQCEIPKCDSILATSPLVCSGKGTCEETHVCVDCEEGFYGDFCDVILCFNLFSNSSGVCSGHGECIGFNNCSCDQNYSSNDCSSWSCNGINKDNPLVCNGNGTCVSFDNCSCSNGYLGEYCDDWDCNGVSHSDPSVCDDHGECTKPEICNCELHYTSSTSEDNRCDLTSCFSISSMSPLTCSGNGSCDSYNHCSCEEGYYGFDCQYWDCDGISFNQTSDVCHNHGTCVSPDICNCEEHYFSSNTFCDETTCSGISSNDPASCNYGNGTCLGYNDCNCSEGYSGDACQNWYCDGILFSDHTNVCSGHGACVAPEHCACENGYTESFCSETTCNGIDAKSPQVCNYGNGTCESYNNCSCNSGYYGKFCQNWYCDSVLSTSVEVCHGQGVCISPDICVCYNYSLFSGEFCGTANCNGFSDPALACNNRGNCTDENICECDIDTDLWGGDFCQIPKCNYTLSTDPDVCNDKRGVCIGSTHTCVCDDRSKWIGDYCTIPVCNGLSRLNGSLQCNERGRCVSPNRCTCFDDYNWGGGDCEVPKCYGILQSNDSVCGGHGDCEITHTCECSNPALWSGDECDTPVCNGLRATDPLVCSQRGDCKQPGVCSCNVNITEYGGNFCDLPICFGILSNLASSCSLNYECLAPNECSCPSSDWNDDCSIWKCQKVEYTKTAYVCNFGKGECTRPNVCNCTTKDYYGGYCEERIASEGTMNTEKTMLEIDYSIPVSVGWLEDHGIVDIPFSGSNIFNTEDLNKVGGSNTECYFNDGYTILTVKFGDKKNVELENHDVITIQPISGGSKAVILTVSYPHSSSNVETWITSFVIAFLCVLCVCVIVALFVVIVMGLVLCMVVLTGGGTVVHHHVRDSEKFGAELVETLLEQREREYMEEESGFSRHSISNKRLTGSSIERDMLEKKKRWSYQPLEINHELFRIHPNVDLAVDFLIGNDVVGTSIYKARWKMVVEDEDELNEQNDKVGMSKEMRIRLVTLKLIKDKLLFQQDRFSEFEKALKLMQSISHPYILAYFGSALNERLFQVSMIMDCYDNGNLKSYICNHKKGTLTIEKKYEVAKNIIHGMIYLHERAIRHGDLRSENIYLDRELHPKINSDFCVNRILKDIYAVSKGIDADEIENVHYVAPEITNDDDHKHLKSDVFSFSIILYEMFTENFDPFLVFGDYVGIEQKIAQDPNFRPEVDESVFRKFKDISKIVQKCWLHNPSNRWSFEQILERFDN